MGNFEVVLRRKIDRLAVSTPTGRLRVYQAARRMIKSCKTNGHAAAIADEQINLLEEAIARVEAEYAASQQSDAHTLPTIARQAAANLIGGGAAEDQAIIGPVTGRDASTGLATSPPDRHARHLDLGETAGVQGGGASAQPILIARQITQSQPAVADSETSPDPWRFDAVFGELHPDAAGVAQEAAAQSAPNSAGAVKAPSDRRVPNDAVDLDAIPAQPGSPLLAAGEQSAADAAPPNLSPAKDEASSNVIGIEGGSLSSRDALLAHIQESLSRGLVPLDGSWVTADERESSLVKDRLRSRSLTFQAMLAILAVGVLACLVWLLLLAIAY